MGHRLLALMDSETTVECLLAQFVHSVPSNLIVRRTTRQAGISWDNFGKRWGLEVHEHELTMRGMMSLAVG